MAGEGRVCLLVPAPDHRHDWAGDLAQLSAMLASAGIAVETLCWRDAGTATIADDTLVLPLLAWGYADDPAQWHAMLDALEARGVPVRNPVPLLRWNSDKSYLLALARHGVAVVPTLITDALSDAALIEARDHFDCMALVVKPRISAGAAGTHRLMPGDALPADTLGRPMLIQPMMKAIGSEGEYSLFYFGGDYSHAIVKRPAAGDFRVQPLFGGAEESGAPPEGARALARATLAALPVEAPPLYARIDMLRDDAGTLRLMEVELIEPALFLTHAADKGVLFIEQVEAAIVASFQ